MRLTVMPGDGDNRPCPLFCGDGVAGGGSSSVGTTGHAGEPVRLPEEWQQCGCKAHRLTLRYRDWAMP